jgi:hypothetical protein
MFYFGQFSYHDIMADNQSDSAFLSSHYTPGPHDVICARGKSYWDHEGNQMYRRLIAQATKKYSCSTSKHEKSLIVSEIIEAIHKRNGGFVKKEGKGGPWVEVDEGFCREKVGQSLRDGLCNKYRSSTKAKQRRRIQDNEKLNGDIDRVIQSNASVARWIDDLSLEIQKKDNQTASDFSVMALFSRANSDILETIKKDASMLSQFQKASVQLSADKTAHSSNGRDGE